LQQQQEQKNKNPNIMSKEQIAEYEVTAKVQLSGVSQEHLEEEKTAHLDYWKYDLDKGHMSAEEYNSWECLTPEQFAGRLLCDGVLSASDFTGEF
jgi:hypothetical protein